MQIHLVPHLTARANLSTLAPQRKDYLRLIYSLAGTAPCSALAERNGTIKASYCVYGVSSTFTIVSPHSVRCSLLSNNRTDLAFNALSRITRTTIRLHVRRSLHFHGTPREGLINTRDASLRAKATPSSHLDADLNRKGPLCPPQIWLPYRTYEEPRIS